MRFAKNFLKSQQCKMIGCIFLVLLGSIMIKLSMPDTFEHLDYTFKLKFSGTPDPSDVPLSEFIFKIGTDTGTPVKGDESTIEFTKTSLPTTNIVLSISGTPAVKDLLPKLKIANKLGTKNEDGDNYNFTLEKTQYTDPVGITMTDQ